MKCIYKECDFTAARDNMRKNRNSEVVPADVNRVRLMTVVSDRNDYINAVFQNVCRKLSNNDNMVANNGSLILKPDDQMTA